MRLYLAYLQDVAGGSAVWRAKCPNRVSVRIKEGDKERIQAFEGTVIAKKHGGIAETFTVRRTSYGVGVERVFPVNSPFVEKVEVIEKDGEILAHIESVDWLPADVKVVRALEKRGEL